MIFLYIIAFIILWEAIHQDLSDARDLLIKEQIERIELWQRKYEAAFNVNKKDVREHVKNCMIIKELTEGSERLKEEIRVLEFKLNPHKTAR